jgi:hypothetical protein
MSPVDTKTIEGYDQTYIWPDNNKE